MGFRTVAQLAKAFDEGRTHFCSFRKTPSQAAVARHWVDLSMSAGNPVPQYYASSPLEAETLDGNKGFFHGGDVSPAGKFVTDIGLLSGSGGFPGMFRLLDYLLYYPFIDGDSLDQQDLVNGVTLPRYVTGEGVMVMAVASAPTTGGGSFTFTYTDNTGASKTSPVINAGTVAVNIASLLTAQPGGVAGGLPFLPLAEGSRGVRSIESVTLLSPSGGLFALVLVYPLASTCIREVNTMEEKNFVSMFPGCPKVEPGAYLNYICCPAATLAANVLTGYMKFAWGDD